MANYHELIAGKVYIGGEAALLDALREREITDVFDLRDTGTEAEGFPAHVTRHHYPIVEDEGGQEGYIHAAILAVKDAVTNNKTVYFHCAGGRNRTGTVASGLLIELGLAPNVDEAMRLAKDRRPDINIKPEMVQVLHGFYGA
ncbi:dual specificity protein phosphatase family protein [Paenibacillus sp. sgz500958]|uniref:protein-tyrosine phosphatase family protein n=1 Tax=Paenibacillus sp. sgz500958 TaxID=3242475 RepID=UPI0036D335C5